MPSSNSDFEVINEMHRLGYISGYPDGTFRPNDTISRKHVAALLSRVITLETVRESKEFKDVPTTHPNYKSIQAVQRAGLMSGDEYGDFNPEASLTRAQLAKVLDLAFHLEVKSNEDFKDVPAKHWANKHVRALYSNGITTGSNGYFKPNEKVTKALYTVFLYRVLNLNNEEQIITREPSLAEPFPGQLTYYSETELKTSECLAVTMYVMARQKLTMNESDVVTDDELYFQDKGITGELTEQNFLYLKRFVEKDSDEERILNKWLAGDFSEIISDYILLLAIQSADNVAGEPRNYLKVRTKEAEEYYIKEVFGAEALTRHKEH